MSDKPFDPTKPVQTRDGRSARIICTDRVSDSGLTMVALVEVKGREVTRYLTPDGSADIPTWPCGDLVNIPTKREGWVNLYRRTGLEDAPNTRDQGVFEAEATARVYALPGRIATIRIEWEE